MKVKDRIIEAMRVCTDGEFTCRDCPRYEKYLNGGSVGCFVELVHEAADTIESQQKRIAELEAALRTQQEGDNRLESDAVKNKPLTLDELRQMDGEPVWIEKCGRDSRDDKEWALVFSAGGFCRTSVGNIAFFALYGIGWLAYRSKPKGA